MYAPGVVLSRSRLESDFDVLPWGRRVELQLERYVELLRLFHWDVDLLPVEFVVAAVSHDRDGHSGVGRCRGR